MLGRERYFQRRQWIKFIIFDEIWFHAFCTVNFDCSMNSLKNRRTIIQTFRTAIWVSRSKIVQTHTLVVSSSSPSLYKNKDKKIHTLFPPNHNGCLHLPLTHFTLTRFLDTHLKICQIRDNVFTFWSFWCALATTKTKTTTTATTTTETAACEKTTTPE